MLRDLFFDRNSNFNSDKLKTGFFKPSDNFSNKAALDTIGLN